MEFHSKIINDLVAQFVKMPGIGKRTATRMVLNLLKQSKEEIEILSNAVLRVSTDLKYCKYCFNISDNDECEICLDKSRARDTICVVEDIRDVIAIEQTAQYRGLYHVLGGLISPLDGISPDNLKINMLLERLKKGNIKEVIFALNPNMEGDTTMFYISKQIKNQGIKITVIARGISIGGEIEYADEITLGRSIVDRRTYTQ